ncbi:MAG: glycosyl transferase family 2 [Planctomycetaceae bacterium]|nr:glycosyl transferase family 2 [Planctomycetaceae bacterium]
MAASETSSTIAGDSAPQRSLKIAVYGISKNEERHVARFMQSVREADLVLIADTGSGDETVPALRLSGAVVHQVTIVPWRFDDARNSALWLLPSDIDVCISLDLDEVLTPGWRAAIERAWTTETTRLKYKFVSSWNADGSPGTIFWNQRIHARRGYRWQMPIHEVIMWCGEGQESVAICEGFEAHHHPDENKPRSNYLPMLERSAVEHPDDPRSAHYLGREYFYWKQHAAAIRELQRSLALPTATWLPQRAEACRLIGKCSDALGNPADALTWYWKAVVEYPAQRESWVELSRALYLRSDFAGGYYAARRALGITARSLDYFNEPDAWGAQPHDLLSVCAWHIGLKEEAAQQAAIAAKLAPDDSRLQENLLFFQRLNAQHNSESRT